MSIYKYSKYPVFLIFQLCFFYTLQAARVDTVETFSASMNKKIKAVIIIPDLYKKTGTPLATVYLLHGYGSNYASWIQAVPTLKDYADLYHNILVCPDGNIGSWYFDSPVDQSWKYDTYVSKELVNWIDKNYNTIPNRKGRGITGFSMGGHGALYLAFRHQDVYGTAGSMSGGVDFRPFTRNWDIAKRLGSYLEYTENWEKYTVINMIPLLQPGSLDLIIDCGTDDFFYTVNNNFHWRIILFKSFIINSFKTG